MVDSKVGWLKKQNKKVDKHKLKKSWKFCEDNENVER
jgi:hypothetical protein